MIVINHRDIQQQQYLLILRLKKVYLSIYISGYLFGGHKCSVSN